MECQTGERIDRSDGELLPVEHTVFVQNRFDDEDGFSLDECRDEFQIKDGMVLDDYGQLRLIGIGGMGTVFEAADPALDRKIALKLLRSDFRNNPASIAKFIREARVTAKIDHPNIVSVHRLGVLDNVGVYFTMKRVFGETLRTILNRLDSGDAEARRVYTLRRLLEIFIAGCNGIAAAHASGILHCDLKPANLMVGNFGEVLVLDWGVATENAMMGPPEREEATSCTKKCGVEGTPLYMAPELLCGEFALPDEQTDVYGLGCILYSILTWGKAPFDTSLEHDELMQQVAAGKILPLRSNMPKGMKLSKELEAVCMKAMARDRMARYPNVKALLSDIYNYLDGYPVSAYSPGILYWLVKTIRRRPLIPSVLLAAGLTMGAYNLFVRISEYIEESSIYELINYNSHTAENSRMAARRKLARLRDPEQLLEPEDRQKIYQSVEFDVNTATLQYSSALDLGARLRPAKRREFVRNGGAEIFRKLLDMQLRLGNSDMAQELARRFPRQWDMLFFDAVKFNSALEVTVSRIIRKRGAVNIVAPAEAGWQWFVAGVGNINAGEGKYIELDAGIHQVKFFNTAKDDFIAVLDVQPGSVTEYNFWRIPKLIAGTRFIPPDGFMSVKVSDSGDLKQRLDAFIIGEFEVSNGEFRKLQQAFPEHKEFNAIKVSGADDMPAVVSKKGAEMYCRLLAVKLDKRVKLPSAAEWEKAMYTLPGSNGSRVSVYGVRRKADFVEWFDSDAGAAIRKSLRHSRSKVDKAAFRIVIKRTNN